MTSRAMDKGTPGLAGAPSGQAPWCPRCERRETCGLLKRRRERGLKVDGCPKYSTRPAEKGKPSRYKPKPAYYRTRRG